MSLSELFSLGGFVLSVLSLVVAGVAAYGTYRLGHFVFRLTTRHEFQKLLLEVNKELVRDPELWGVYDSHPMARLRQETPQHKAKLEAAVYFKLNIFHIVFSYADELGQHSPGDRAFYAAWDAYCSDFLNDSSLAREILTRPDTESLYDSRFLARIRSLIKRS